MNSRVLCLPVALGLLLPLSPTATAQSRDDLNLQIHGYATQAFVYTNHNNWNTTDSSDGSAAWTEAVVNLTVQPDSRLRVGIQARYFLLGAYGKQIVLDWAQADFKLNEHFGVRVGKVKSPIGLLNEIQDIDPAYLWVLLPQSIYPIASRTSLLAHYGGTVYGSAPLGEKLGKIEYRAFGGDRVIQGNDGLLQPERDAGLSFPNGISGAAAGATLRWKTPVQGLMFGATGNYENTSGAVVAGPLQGTYASAPFVQPNYFATLERKRLMVSGEYNRLALNLNTRFPGLPTFFHTLDQTCWYIMTTYKPTGKLSAGAYYSYSLDHKAALTSSRYQKDWTVASRYDVNPYLYVKLEEHLVNGTSIGFSSTDNSNGLKPQFTLTLLKLGVTF